MPTTEKQAVINAINKLGRRVTAADVASKTGLPLHTATLALNKIASDANGHLEVSTEGDIAYKFDFGFEKAYLATGIAAIIEVITHKAFEVGFFLLRISFGIMLVLSFIVVIVLIVAIMLALRSQGNDRDGGGGGGFDFNLDFFDYMILRDLFWWGAWGSYGDPYYQSYDRPTIKRPTQDKGNFLFNVFSFLFGDGDPNKNLEERKWQMIAEVIHANKGVVIAEQIAPYTGADPKNEDDMLPVLVRFEGKPEVTEKGNIVYTFPNMQARASISQFKGGYVPAFLQEFPWQFSSVTPDGMIPIYVLAGVNFFGSWWAAYEITHVPRLLLTLGGFIPLLGPLTWYGTAFLLVPLIRLLVLKVLNKRIEARNAKRQEHAVVMQNKTAELLKKLGDAAQFRVTDRIVSSEHIVYTTEKDVNDQHIDPLEQEFEAMAHKHSPGPKLASAGEKHSGQSTPKHEQPEVWNPTNFAPDQSTAQPIDANHLGHTLHTGEKIHIKDKDKLES